MSSLGFWATLLLLLWPKGFVIVLFVRASLLESICLLLISCSDLFQRHLIFSIFCIRISICWWVIIVACLGRSVVLIFSLGWHVCIFLSHREIFLVLVKRVLRPSFNWQLVKIPVAIVAICWDMIFGIWLIIFEVFVVITAFYFRPLCIIGWVRSTVIVLKR